MEVWKNGVWGRNQLGRIKDLRIMGRERERSYTEEDARGSGDDQTEKDGEEGFEHWQPDGTVESAIYTFFL